MKGKVLTMLAVTGLAILLGISPGSAQGDLAKVLVGKWEGAIQWSGGAGSRVDDPNRTLTIDSVEQKDGKWVAMGKYGYTGKWLDKVSIEVYDSGGRPFIRFVTGANSTVRLTLTGAKQLTGTLSTMGTGLGRGNDNAMNLEKKE